MLKGIQLMSKEKPGKDGKIHQTYMQAPVGVDTTC